MISRDQIRAARALLDWGQPQLAELADVSTDLISKIENGVTAGSVKTLEKIESVFKREGITFTKYGVERRDYTFYEIGGTDNWWMEVLQDVYETLVEMPEEKREVIFICSDDSMSPPHVNAMLRKLRDTGIKFRQLVEEGNTYLMAPLSEYRYVPSKFYLNNVTLIYADKVAICAEENTKAVIFRDGALRTSWKNLIELLWEDLPQPEKSNAKEKF